MRPQPQRFNADILGLGSKWPKNRYYPQPSGSGCPSKDTQYVNFKRVFTIDKKNFQIYDERNLIILSRHEILEHNQYKHDFALAPLYRIVTAITNVGRNKLQKK